LSSSTVSMRVVAALLVMGVAALPEAQAQDQPPPPPKAEQPQRPADTPLHTQVQPDPERVEIAERECRERLQKVESEATMPESEALVIARRDLRTIREAALAFARAGHQEGCEEVANELSTLLQERRQAAERTLELQRVRQAMPVTQLPFSVTASELVGSEVVNHELKSLGTLEDLVISETEGRYALIRHGGFLGLGRNYTPVALDRVRMTEDGDLLVVHASEEALENAPEIDPEQLTQLEAWSQTVDQWWTANVGPPPGGGQPPQAPPPQAPPPQ
jgi:sporulation protein YlmC with PRC-barrel domain